MKKIFIHSFAIIYILLLVGTSHIVLADPVGGGSGTTQTGGGSGTTEINAKIVNPFKLGGSATLIDFFLAILNNIILPIGGIIAVLAFIWAGFLYVTAQGNQEQISKAHKALLYSAIGTALLVGSGAIALVIKNTINQL